MRRNTYILGRSAIVAGLEKRSKTIIVKKKYVNETTTTKYMLEGLLLWKKKCVNETTRTKYMVKCLKYLQHSPKRYRCWSRKKEKTDEY